MAIFPIFGYQWAYNNYLPFLSHYLIFQPLLQNSFVLGFVYFILNTGLLAILLFTLSCVLTVILTLISHDTLKNSHQALKDEPLNFVGVAIIMGVVIVVESVTRQWAHQSIIAATLGSLLFLVIIEEYVKHLVVRLVDDKKLKEVDDAITLSIMVGLAFAFMETIIYSIWKNDLNLIIYRIFLSVPIHIIASGIFGYFYGLAHFSQPITAATKPTWSLRWLHKILMVKTSTVYKEEKMLEGLLLATLFHAVANILFELGLAFIVVPLVVAGLWLLFALYNKKISRRAWGPSRGIEMMPKQY
ncbi:PrsW family intramembrane metalloprotease [Candidatus Peregrinibacteria bacterium]|nr:PrsW family intramembrane metalloprotease [Candidatus Peregrinibacteria bacterium]